MPSLESNQIEPIDSKYARHALLAMDLAAVEHDGVFAQLPV